MWRKKSLTEQELEHLVNEVAMDDSGGDSSDSERADFESDGSCYSPSHKVSSDSDEDSTAEDISLSASAPFLGMYLHSILD